MMFRQAAGLWQRMEQCTRPFRSLLSTTQLNLHQFAWALVPAIALLARWVLGKLVARRRMAAKLISA